MSDGDTRRWEPGFTLIVVGSGLLVLGLLAVAVTSIPGVSFALFLPMLTDTSALLLYVAAFVLSTIGLICLVIGLALTFHRHRKGASI